MNRRFPTGTSAVHEPPAPRTLNSAVEKGWSDGLSSAAARSRLLQFGPNELPQVPRRGVGRILLGVLSEPMFLLLAAAAIIYLAIGGIGEGLLMAGFAGLSILLVVVQEARSEGAIAALRALAAPMARVVRDGRERRIAAREVVPGDLLLVADGERIAADAVLRRAENVTVDESLLTGESVPVAKSAAAEHCRLPLNDDERGNLMLYASTLITSGRGAAEVVATGPRTEAGRIGASLASIEIEPTLLQRSFGRLVRLFALLALSSSVLVVLLYGWFRGAWLQGVLSGIALGMATVPEEFPMVLVVFVALGARRLARLHVLARRTAVIEVLGACSTLCVDKTGTLTENRMRVCGLATLHERIDVNGSESILPDTFADLVWIAARASARTANDPMDLAVHRLADATGNTAGANAQPIREYGLAQERPAVVRVWLLEGGAIQVAAKGAPECIADMCRLDGPQREQLLRDVERYARDGIRVLAVARSQLQRSSLPDSPSDLGLQLAGLLAFADPLRPSARQAIAAAHRAGVRVIMMTGDHPATALAIAREAGIDNAGPAVTGVQLADADDERLRELVKTTRVFARIRPDQKLRIVRALKDDGEVVAMTGDGVNDAPALKAAHIGLAMGSRATDVAREAASIVLMEDDLGHLISGIQMGRRIFDNLRKASIYIAAIHVPIAGLTLLPLLLGLPPLLLPLHVVLVEMVIDPVCAIAFENEPAEAGIMQQAPRRPDAPLLGWPQLLIALLQGLLLLASALGIYVFALAVPGGVESARALAFICFTAGNLMLIRVAATRGPTLRSLTAADHRAYWLVAGLAVAVTGACIFVPVLRHLFQFAAPPADFVLLAIIAGLVSALLFDLAKRLPGVRHALGPTAA